MSSACKVLLLVVLLVGVAVAAEPSPSAPTREQIDRWLKQLGDSDFTLREQATLKLWEAGRAAEPGLRALLKSDDAEIVRRVQEILDKFRWGLYPDTPRATVERITRYQEGDQEAKQAVARELLDLGADGCSVLLRIVRAEGNEEVRRELFRQVSQEAGRAVPDLILRKQFTALDDLLELTIEADLDFAVESYTAYALLRGNLDERITEATRRAESAKDGKSWQLLAHLHRAKGDLKAAAKAADKAEKPELREAILAEAMQWAELAQRDVEPSEGFDRLGLKALYQRLAGDRDAAEKTLSAIVQRAEAPDGQEGAIEAARCLLLNERPADALRVLLQAKRHVMAFDVLVGQMRFREALELADKADKDTLDDLRTLQIHRARLHHQIGDAAGAARILDRLADDIPTEGDLPGWLEELVGTEYAVGRKEQAIRHAEQALAIAVEGSHARLLEKVFPGRADEASFWWRILRKKFSDEKPEASMKRIQKLLAVKPDVREVETLVREAIRETETLSPVEKESDLVAIARTCFRSDLETLGRSCLEQAATVGGSVKPLIQLGDRYAAKKQWEQAAERYGRAWEKDRKDPLSLFLQGWAMVQSGAVADGRRRMELAHWMPLGDETQREAFGTELKQRGHAEAAMREFELLRRTGRPGSFVAGEARRQLGIEAVEARKFAVAAEYHQQAMLRVLSPFALYEDASAYLTVPHYIGVLRARAMLEAGRIDEALRFTEQGLELEPGNADLAILLIPALEKQRRTREADELFERIRKFLVKRVEDHPESGWAHNSLAWLCAGCRRQLDLGLKHARKAVELQPDSAPNLDTLAEIHFQRGDRDEAITLMKKCLVLDDSRSYFRKQLVRFEKGDRTAELPSEDQ